MDLCYDGRDFVDGPLLRRVDRPRSAKGGANLKAQQHSNLV
jgi:hypothetical protein